MYTQVHEQTWLRMYVRVRVHAQAYACTVGLLVCEDAYVRICTSPYILKAFAADAQARILISHQSPRARRPASVPTSCLP